MFTKCLRDIFLLSGRTILSAEEAIGFVASISTKPFRDSWKTSAAHSPQTVQNTNFRNFRKGFPIPLLWRSLELTDEVFQCHILSHLTSPFCMISTSKGILCRSRMDSASPLDCPEQLSPLGVLAPLGGLNSLGQENRLLCSYSCSKMAFKCKPPGREEQHSHQGRLMFSPSRNLSKSTFG